MRIQASLFTNHSGKIEAIILVESVGLTVVRDPVPYCSEIAYQNYCRRVFAELYFLCPEESHGPSRHTLIQGYWIIRNAMEYQSYLKQVPESSNPNMQQVFPNDPVF